MADQNSNNPNDPRVRLIFDVMPDQPKGSETIDLKPSAEGAIFKAPPRMSQQAPPPPPQPSQKTNHEPAYSPAGDFSRPEAGYGKKSFFGGISSSLNNPRIIIGIAIVLVLAAASYFGYRYFAGIQSNKKAVENSVAEKNNVPPAQPMPQEWLKKYFGIDTCSEPSCQPEADPDNDGLTNSKEAQYNTDPLSPDTDRDGLADGDEVLVYNSDPLVADTDGDGFEDGVEVRNGYSPTQASKQPMSNIEKQVLADNEQNFGLHEPTKTFLRMKSYRTAFSADGGLKVLPVQIAFSVPKNLALVENPNSVYFKDEKGAIVLSVNAAPVASSTLSEIVKQARKKLTTLNGYKSIKQLDRNSSGSNFSDNEYLFSQNGTSQHVRETYLAKKDYAFSLSFTVPETDWEDSKIMSQIIIDSIR